LFAFLSLGVTRVLSNTSSSNIENFRFIPACLAKINIKTPLASSSNIEITEI